MDSLRLCISTQTPPTSSAFAPGRNGPRVRHWWQRRRPSRRARVDGSPAVALQSLRHWLETGWAREADWFSLDAEDADAPTLEELPVRVHALPLAAEDVPSCAATREKLWSSLHGRDARALDASDIAAYGRFGTDAARTIHAHGRFDLAYIHDLQLLSLGGPLRPLMPSVLRWHAPFVPERIPEATRDFLLDQLARFDVVIVNTLRDLQGLRRAGFKGEVRQIYPHIDMTSWSEPSPQDIHDVEATFGLGTDDPVILMVAHMEPTKRQDVAVRAIARLRAQHPGLRLLLVGNGSGLSEAPAASWVNHVRDVARDADATDRMVFADRVTEAQLRSLYARCEAVVIPADIQGFGMSALEGWRYQRPVVMSRGVGAAEIVENGVNGFVFPEGDDAALADVLGRLLRSPGTALAVGEAGSRGLWRFDVNERARQLTDAMEWSIQRWRDTAPAALAR